MDIVYIEKTLKCTENLMKKEVVTRLKLKQKLKLIEVIVQKM